MVSGSKVSVYACVQSRRCPHNSSTHREFQITDVAECSTWNSGQISQDDDDDTQSRAIPFALLNS